MEDRLIELSGIPEKEISEHKLEFLLEDEYIVPEGIFLYQQEIDEYTQAAKEMYDIMIDQLAKIVRERDFNYFGFPPAAVDLIIKSFEDADLHLLGRFDFAGGITDLPIKLLEFNADMPTMIPETVIIQDGFNSLLPTRPYNDLFNLLSASFNNLNIKTQGASLLGTTFGHQEDRSNVEVLLTIAEQEGIEVNYADFPAIEFAPNEGIYVEVNEDEFLKYDILLKLIPWEYIVFEEPDLLDDLHNLVTQDLLKIINPAYSLVFQSKKFLAKLSEQYHSNILLKTTLDSSDFKSRKYVEKVVFGRLGENIRIIDENAQVIESTSGDFGEYDRIYQEFAELYKDDYGEYYQPGIYLVNGNPAALSFRRGEGLIINDDCQFIPHCVKL